MMEFGQKRWTSYDVLLVDPFPIEKQHKFTRIWILLQKKTTTEKKIFKKNAISESVMMKFGQKMMNLLWSPARWPIAIEKQHK